uniref:O-fucosyltransferase family protein n=1 Tax=Pyramimonas obovata TaxID=1411642 RepID=A0A7S0WSS6_9CHLO|mmetsp:Transcript_38277/g.83266  ORF Transcript_38277/g.83266 Transcript_38277/m.83266 type:complete len:225 (+) Transcript_38277:437-1111(+)
MYMPTRCWSSSRRVLLRPWPTTRALTLLLLLALATVEALSLQPLSSPASSITSSTDATRISRRPMIMTTTIEDETISGIRRSSTSVSSSTTRQLFAAANNGDDEKAVVDIVVHHEVDVLLAGGSSGPSTRHLNRKLLRELSIDTFVSPRGWNLLPAHGFYFPGYLARDFIYPYKIRKYLVRHLTFPFYTNNIKQLVENLSLQRVAQIFGTRSLCLPYFVCLGFS